MVVGGYLRKNINVFLSHLRSVYFNVKLEKLTGGQFQHVFFWNRSASHIFVECGFWPAYMYDRSSVAVLAQVPF